MHNMAAFSHASPPLLLRQRGLFTLRQKREFYQRVADISVRKLQTTVASPSAALLITHLVRRRYQRFLLILSHQRELFLGTQLLHTLHTHFAVSFQAETHKQRIARLRLTSARSPTNKPTLSLEKMCTYSISSRSRRSRRPLNESALNSPPLPLGERAIWGTRKWQKYAVFFAH